MPTRLIDFSIIDQIYTHSCDLIDLIVELDDQQNLASYGPVFVHRSTHVAAIAVLRIMKSPYRDRVAFERGQAAYFAVIEYHRKCAVRPDDAFARFSLILSQLWTSSRLFSHPTGELQSLRVRSRNRLGMSMVYDCFWWWRQEFGGQIDAYEGADGSQASPRPRNLLTWFQMVKSMPITTLAAYRTRHLLPQTLVLL